MATTADFRNGMVLRIEGDLWQVTFFQHVKPGKGGAFVRTKLKRVDTGQVVDRTFRAGERVEEVRLERRRMQYLYSSDHHAYFMDLESYEQHAVSEAMLDEQKLFLIENTVCDLLMHDGGTIGVELPNFIEAEIVETEPGVRGDTATGGTKPARLVTGAIIQVPLFVNRGQKVRIDTRSREYLERVT